MENKLVTIQRLMRLDQGNEVLHELGFHQFRLHRHDQLVRIEVTQAEMERAFRSDVVLELARRFKTLGFKYVTLDLKDFRPDE